MDRADWYRFNTRRLMRRYSITGWWPRDWIWEENVMRALWGDR